MRENRESLCLPVRLITAERVGKAATRKYKRHTVLEPHP